MGDLDFLYSVDAKIDGIVKMNAEIAKSLKGLHDLDKQTTGAGHSTEKLSQASHHAASGHDKHAHSLINLGHQFEYAKNGANELLEAMGIMLAFEGLETLVDKIKEVGEEMVKTAAKAERSRISMELFFGKETGNQLLEYAEQFSKVTEFSLDDVKGYISELGRAGFTAQQIPRALQAAGDLASRFSDKTQGMQSAIEGLSRIQATGVIEKRGFARLGIGEENAPEKFYAELSKRTGKGVEQLKKDIEKGKVPVKEEIESLYSIIGGKTGTLGGSAVEIGKGMEAKLTHLKEAPEKLFEGLADSPGFAAFKGQLEKLTMLLDPSSPVGAKLAENLEKAFGKFVDVLGKIDIEKLSKDLISLFEELPGLVKATTEAVVGLVGAMDQLLRGLKAFRAEKAGGPAPEGAGAKVGWAANLGLRPLENELERLLGFKKGGGVGEAVASIVTVGHLTDRLGLTGKNGGKAFADGLGSAKDAVAKAGADLGEAAHGATREELKIHSPSKVFEDLGEMSGEGYRRGLDSSLGGMSDSVPRGAFVRPAGAGGGGPIQVSVHVETHVQAGQAAAENPEQLGQQIATHVEAILPGALQSAFERMGLEAGSGDA